MYTTNTSIYAFVSTFFNLMCCGCDWQMSTYCVRQSKARCRWMNGSKIMPLFCTNSTPLVCLFASTRRRRCYIFMFDWYSLKCNPIWTRKLKLNWCNLKSEVNIWLLTFSIYWIVFGFCCTLLLVHVEIECFWKLNHLSCKKPYYMLEQVKWVSVT